MTSIELAKMMVERGIVEPFYERDAANALQQGINQKGEEAVTNKCQLRKKPIIGNPRTIIGLMIADLQNKTSSDTVDDLEERKQPTIAEEWNQEVNDLRQWEEHFKLMKEVFPQGEQPTFKKADDPSFDQSPSIFEAEPYSSASEETKQLYKKYTFIEVLRLARDSKTSMHEICRRKGLRYEALIV